MSELQKEHIDRIIDFLDLNQEGFDLSSYKEDLKQKTLQGTLTLKDSLFISLNEKGLKILEKSFVKDPNAEMLSQVFPFNTDIDKPGGGTLAESPTPKSAISNWNNLVNKIQKKTGQDVKEILNTPILSYIKEGVSKELNMESAKGGSSALRQGVFYARKQLGFSKDDKDIIRNTYLSDDTLRQELGGSKIYGQKRLVGRGLATRSIRASDAPLITQAVKEGMSVITDPDAKAAIMYNILIPHRTVQVSSLRINPERDAKGEILKDATDPYLEGNKIVVPEEGAKKGQKRYTTIELTPFMKNFLGQIAANNPDRTYLFRDNNVNQKTFDARINNALQLPGGIGEKTQAFVDAGKFTGPVNTFGMLRKLSAMSTALYVPGSFGNLRYIMGHTNMKQVGSETGIDQQQKIHYIGDVQEGRTDLEVMKLYEDELQKSSGASSKREFLRSTFNINEVELSDNFVETPLEAQIAGKTSSQSFIDRQVFAATLDNDPELSQSAKENLLERFGDKPNSIQLLENYRKEIDSSYSVYKEAVEKVGGAVVDEDQYFDQVASGKVDFSSVETSLPSVTDPEKTPSVKTSKAVEEIEAPLEKTPFEFTDTSGNEPLTAREKSRRASDTLQKLKEGTLSTVKRVGLKLAVGALTGGAGFLGYAADAAADVALDPTPLGFGGLDPTEKILGTPTSDISDKELFQKMQDAASQRFSPDMAERTTALADIEANREGFAARAFDAPSRMKAEQADLTELDYTTPELERMNLSDTLQDVDTSEVFTEKARDARMQAQMDAALLFNQQ